MTGFIDQPNGSFFSFDLLSLTLKKLSNKNNAAEDDEREKTREQKIITNIVWVSGAYLELRLCPVVRVQRCCRQIDASVYAVAANKNKNYFFVLF